LKKNANVYHLTKQNCSPELLLLAKKQQLD